MNSIWHAEKHYREKTSIRELVASIKGEMSRLQLDVVNKAFRRPIQFLDEAYAIVEYPTIADPVTSVILPVRSAIDSTIDELLHRRPVQGPAGTRTEKILSIGLQCARSGLPPDQFAEFAKSDRQLNAELSGDGKRKAMESAQVIGLFHRSALFLRGLLQALDEGRLRPPPQP